MSENPFLKKANKKRTLGNNSARRMPKRKVKLNREGYDRRRDNALERIEELGINVGDTIRVEWDYDRRFGSDGKGYHEGRVSELDTWLRLEGSSRSPGHLYLPIASLDIDGIHCVKKASRKTPKFKVKR